MSRQLYRLNTKKGEATAGPATTSLCHIGVCVTGTPWLCNEQAFCHSWLKLSLIAKYRNNFRPMVSSLSLLCCKSGVVWGRGWEDVTLLICIHGPLCFEASWNQDANGDLRRAHRPAVSPPIQQPHQEVDANSPNCLSFANEARHKRAASLVWAEAMRSRDKLLPLTFRCAS